jgi:hypothetical protein
MKIDNDPMLETDHLEQLLETPAPSPPVVVVEYRNRGVPSWIFYPTMFLIPLGAIAFYHRMVVERYRVQAARDRSSILRQIEADRALQPLVRETGPSTTVLPTPHPVTPAPGTGDDSGSSVSLTAAALARVGDETQPPSVSNPPKSTTEVAGSPATSPATLVGSEFPNPSGIIGASGPMPILHPVSGNASPATPRSPNGGAGSTTAIAQSEPALPAPTADSADKSVLGANGGPPSGVTPDTGGNDTAPPTAEVAAIRAPGEERRVGAPDPAAQVAGRDGPAGLQTLPPLPTKEEEQRAIEEEADRRAAAIVAQHENKNADLRSRWLEDQVKFREELAEVVRSKRNLAGPDIAGLDKRFAYQGDPNRYTQAFHIWRLLRKSDQAKVKHLRSLELPESAILEFMCASLDTTIGTRGGPRDRNEVWVRAARQLLSYPLATVSADRRPENAPGERALPPQKKVVSPPR